MPLPSTCSNSCGSNNSNSNINSCNDNCNNVRSPCSLPLLLVPSGRKWSPKSWPRPSLLQRQRLHTKTISERPLLAAALLLLLCAVGCRGSEGDRAVPFYTCTWHCRQTGCTDMPGRSPICDTACPHFNQLPVPLHLRLTQWRCEDDCRYHCMHEAEASRRQEHHRQLQQLLQPQQQQQHEASTASAAGHDGDNEASTSFSKSSSLPPSPSSSYLGSVQTFKYFGKWPFKRVLGAQEIMSSLLSLVNLAAHLHCSLRLCSACQRQRTRGGSRYPYLNMWVMYTVVHINAWSCSAVFHVRDTWLTERLDYCSANLVVGASLICAIMRAVWPRYRAASTAAACLVVGCVAQHLHYMLAVKFDYGWNLKFCLLLGAANTLAWIMHCQAVRHPHRWKLYRFLALVYCALLLEVLDFPPVWGGLLDAHALWHATTVPLVYIFYGFVHGDLAWTAALAKLKSKD